VEEFELRGGVVGAWGETWKVSYILARGVL
jgi:hypothetical protein